MKVWTIEKSKLYEMVFYTSLALPSESLPVVSLARIPPGLRRGSTPGLRGDPKVILLVTFVDWAKLIFVTDERMNGWINKQMDKLTCRLK